MTFVPFKDCVKRYAGLHCNDAEGRIKSLSITKPKTDMTSELCSRIVGGKYFSFLFNKTTDPSEVFGPFSLTAMERDQFIRKTTGYLPEAHIAYMDEINTMVSFI